MRRRFRFFLILAIATGHLLRPQQPMFRVFSTQDGLVRNWVTKIHRDSKGYLWFCTVEGISLFDGYRFANFSTRDGLPSRLVADMIETQRGDYWFATGAGLARFHKDHGKAPVFDAIRVGNSKESNAVQEVYEGRDATAIWCGTNAGLYRFRPQDGEARSAPDAAGCCGSPGGASSGGRFAAKPLGGHTARPSSAPSQRRNRFPTHSQYHGAHRVYAGRRA